MMRQPACEDMDAIRETMCRDIRDRSTHRVCQIRQMIALGIYPALATGCWCKTEGPGGWQVPCPDLPSVASADTGKIEQRRLPDMTKEPWFPR